MKLLIVCYEYFEICSLGPGRPGDIGGPQRGPPGLLDRGSVSGPGSGRPSGMGGPPPHDIGSRGGPPQREMRDPRMDRMDPRQGRGPPPSSAPGGPRPVHMFFTHYVVYLLSH